MPAGVPWATYAKMLASSLLAMCAGAEVVHRYYRPDLVSARGAGRARLPACLLALLLALPLALSGLPPWLCARLSFLPGSTRALPRAS